MYFNRKNYRVLRYIYKHPGVSEGTLRKILDYDHIRWLIPELIFEGYVGGQLVDGTFIDPKSCPSITTAADTKFYCLAKGDAIVEDRRWEIGKWLLPLVFSAISLCIAVVNLILNLLR